MCVLVSVGLKPFDMTNPDSNRRRRSSVSRTPLAPIENQGGEGVRGLTVKTKASTPIVPSKNFPFSPSPQNCRLSDVSGNSSVRTPAVRQRPRRPSQDEMSTRQQFGGVANSRLCRIPSSPSVSQRASKKIGRQQDQLQNQCDAPKTANDTPKIGYDMSKLETYKVKAYEAQLKLLASEEWIEAHRNEVEELQLFCGEELRQKNLENSEVRSLLLQMEQMLDEEKSKCLDFNKKIDELTMKLSEAKSENASLRATVELCEMINTAEVEEEEGNNNEARREAQWKSDMDCLKMQLNDEREARLEMERLLTAKKNQEDYPELQEKQIRELTKKATLLEEHCRTEFESMARKMNETSVQYKEMLQCKDEEIHILTENLQDSKSQFSDLQTAHKNALLKCDKMSIDLKKAVLFGEEFAAQDGLEDEMDATRRKITKAKIEETQKSELDLRRSTEELVKLRAENSSLRAQLEKERNEYIQFVRGVEVEKKDMTAEMKLMKEKIETLTQQIENERPLSHEGVDEIAFMVKERECIGSHLNLNIPCSMDDGRTRVFGRTESELSFDSSSTVTSDALEGGTIESIALQRYLNRRQRASDKLNRNMRNRNFVRAYP